MINVTYRVTKRGLGRFVIEALRADYGTWRHIDEFPTLKEATARMAKLEKILRASRGEPA